MNKLNKVGFRFLTKSKALTISCISCIFFSVLVVVLMVNFFSISQKNYRQSIKEMMGGADYTVTTSDGSPISKDVIEKIQHLDGIKEVPEAKTIKETPKFVAPKQGEKILYVKLGTWDQDVVKMATKIMEMHPGRMAVCFFCADTKKRFFAPDHLRVDESSDVFSKLQAVFGENNVKIS